MVALPYVALVLFAITVAVYPTVLNPGLPLALVGGLSVWAGLVKLFRGSGKYYCPVQEVAVGLWAWLGVSLAYHRIDLYLGEKSLLTFLGGVVFFVVPQLGVLSARRFRPLVVALYVLTVLVCVASWVEEAPAIWASGALADFKGRFANPDTLSIVPMLGFCLGLGLTERLRERLLPLHVALMSCLLLTIFATGCRSALLGTVCGLSVFVGLVRGCRPREIDQSRFLLTVPIVLGLAGLLLSALNFVAVEKYMAGLTDVASAVGSTRVEVAQNGWRAVLQNPLLGGGPGSFGLVYQGFRPPGHDELYVDIAHNDYIEMAVEGGVVGLALWVGIQVLVGRRLLRCVKKGKRPFLAAGLLSALVSVGVYSVINFVLPERPVLWLFLFTLGLGATFPTRQVRDRESPRARIISGVVLVFGGLWCSWFGVASIRAEHYSLESSLYAKMLAKEQALEALEKAIDCEPDRAMFYVRAADVARALELLTDDSRWLREQESLLAKAHACSPRMVRPLVEQFELFSRLKNYDRAEQALGEAMTRAPYRQDLMLKSVALNVRCGRYVEACKLLFPCVRKVGTPEYKQLRGLLKLIAANEPAQALSLFKAWREDSKNTMILASLTLELSSGAVREQKWDSAELFLEEARFYNGDDLCVRLQLAQLKEIRFGKDEALGDLKKLLPESESLRGGCAKEVVQAYLGLLGRVKGQDAAEAFLKKEIAAYPRATGYRLWMSSLLLKTNREREAEKVLRDGLEAGASSEALALELARLYERVGSKELSAGYYRRVLQAKPDSAEAKQGLQRVLK